MCDIGYTQWDVVMVAVMYLIIYVKPLTSTTKYLNNMQENWVPSCPCVLFMEVSFARFPKSIHLPLTKSGWSHMKWVKHNSCRKRKKLQLFLLEGIRSRNEFHDCGLSFRDVAYCGRQWCPGPVCRRWEADAMSWLLTVCEWESVLADNNSEMLSFYTAWIGKKHLFAINTTVTSSSNIWGRASASRYKYLAFLSVCAMNLVSDQYQW